MDGEFKFKSSCLIDVRTNYLQTTCIQGKRDCHLIKHRDCLGVGRANQEMLVTERLHQIKYRNHY